MSYYIAKENKKHKKKVKRIVGGGIILAGFAVIIYFFMPLVSYQLYFGGSMKEIETPVPKSAMVQKEKNSVVELISQGISQITTDFTDARNWYPEVHAANNTSVQTYSLSVPSLEIENAEVSTTDYDLEKHLIQYAGTSTPGERGTSVIFGHSTLPQFFDPENYKTIFANLHTIQEGDEVIATVNGTKYTYTVFSKTITTPEDTDMFTQTFDDSYITIVTCTPPGTVWKRLVVKAKLSSEEKSAALPLAVSD